MNAEQIKALLDEHRWEPNWSRCSCGRGHIPTARSHRRHLAEVIARAAGEREAQIRALADEWEGRGYAMYDSCADDLRALLAGDERRTGALLAHPNELRAAMGYEGEKPDELGDRA